MNAQMKTLCAAVLFFCLSAMPAAAQAPVRYKFSFTPTVGLVQPFTFEIVANDFITPGPLSFTPFSFTDGTRVWTMIQGAACNARGVFGQFDFTSQASPTRTDCFGDAQGLNATFVFQLDYPLPTRAGTYQSAGPGVTVISGVAGSEARGIVTIDVSSGPSLTLTLSPDTVSPYVPSSSPGGPSIPPLVEIEATLDPPPAAGQPVTFSLKPADLDAIGGHEHPSLSAAELNHAAFIDDNGSRIMPHQCTTDPTTGACHVFLLTHGPGCGDPGKQIGTGNRVSNGWCEVAGDYAVTATSSGATNVSKTISVGKDPGDFLPPQAAAGSHYITAVNPTGHSRFTHGVPNMISGATTGVQCLAETFWVKSGGFVVSFNDLSLPRGGLFDSGGGQRWHPPHLYHRLGTSVDINNLTVQDLTGEQKYFRTTVPDPDRPGEDMVVDLPMYDVLQEAADQCGLYPVEEDSIHFELRSAFR